MLGKLVNKFKKQSIHDGINLSPPKHISSSPAILENSNNFQQQNEQHRRRSARLNPELATVSVFLNKVVSKAKRLGTKTTTKQSCQDLFSEINVLFAGNRAKTFFKFLLLCWRFCRLQEKLAFFWKFYIYFLRKQCVIYLFILPSIYEFF